MRINVVWKGARAIAIGVVALAATALATLGAQGTGRIRGHVFDADDSSAVQAAQVTIVGTAIGALSSAGGSFVLQGVPPGAHTLRIQRIGYTLKTQAVTVAAGAEATADVYLAKAATRLSEVI